jgi:hypothetical protein
MKRILAYLNFVTPVKSEQHVIPEALVDEELVRLVKRVPRTKAEKQFHAWLVAWKAQLKENK